MEREQEGRKVVKPIEMKELSEADRQQVKEALQALVAANPRPVPIIQREDCREEQDM